MKDRYLQSLWVRVRLEILLLADGPITSYNTDLVSEGKSEDSEPRPAGEELRALENRWAGCRNDKNRRDVLNDALEYIKRHRIRRLAPTQKRDTKEWKEAIAFDERGVGVVAYSHGIGVERVRQIRQDFGIEPRPVGRPW